MTDSLRRRLLAAEREHASRTALWVEGQQWSYAELFAEARELGAKFDETVGAGLPVGIFCQRDQSSILGILAAVLSGRPYLPLNPGFPLDRLAAIIAIGRPGLLLCSAETRPTAEVILQDLPAGLPLFELKKEIARGTGPSPGVSGDPILTVAEPIAYLMFTSGTTGVPKGVRVLERNLLAYLDGIAPIASIGPGDRATHFFDLSFDLSVHDIFVTLLAGAELCVLPKSLSMAVPEFVRDRKITHWFSVPSLAAFCDRLGQLAPGALNDLRSVLFCGEALPVSVVRRFREAAPRARIWNIYGPTEATIAFTAYEVKQPDKLEDSALVPIGWPIGQERIKLEALEDPPFPGAGELCLGGRQVTPGYMNNPELNASRFSESDGVRWYRTGDVVGLSELHGILFFGRIDDQVKINGYRVELQEIDAILRQAAETPEVAAIPWPVLASGQADQVVGFVVGSAVAQAEIRRRCRMQLAPYMVPRKIIVLERLPLTVSGKIDRKALRGLLDTGKG